MTFQNALTSSLAALLVSGQIAFAAGSDTDSTPKPTETTTQCEKGMVWDKKEKECVKIKESNLSDDSIYENARELAYAGQFDNAIELLTRAENQNDPRILNYLGFSHRKAGRTALGMSYYQQALAIDPKYDLARSYMGQSLVKQGKLGAAQEQLALIAQNSGTDNWPYQSLATAITTGNSSNY